MKVIDPGHIYHLDPVNNNPPVVLKFVKRSGGAVTYTEEWPGIQTQAVMRAVIEHLRLLFVNPHRQRLYDLWQLGSDEPQTIVIGSDDTVGDILDVLIDRSIYLNHILSCVETLDAIQWMMDAKDFLVSDHHDDETNYSHAIHSVRMALWCYEARAYRRKKEQVNRLHPSHNDSVRPKPWRAQLCEDVPFNDVGIEKIPIGPDGHIVLEYSNAN
jgi:hypothetical protein